MCVVCVCVVVGGGGNGRHSVSNYGFGFGGCCQFLLLVVFVVVLGCLEGLFLWCVFIISF